MSQQSIEEAAKNLTPEQALKALRLLSFFRDGCDFSNSRNFKGGSCSEETGKGFDCSRCSIRKFFEELRIQIR